MNFDRLPAEFPLAGDHVLSFIELMAARAIALFAGSFTVVNLLGNIIWPGFDASRWWITFGPIPASFVHLLLAVFAVVMLDFALRWRNRPPRFLMAGVVALLFAGVALVNAAGYYRMEASGKITGLPVPFSLFVAAGLLFVAYTAWRGEPAKPARLAFVVAGAAALFALFPLALMLFFGNSDYRGPADVAVVFGARVYANGRMSDALRDRIRTACELYHEGMFRRLILSGGRGAGAITEADAMRDYALAHGVPGSVITVDNNGFNTEATVRDTVPMFKRYRATRVLAISHFYHLPRIKLAYQRAGVDVRTVPARQERVLAQIPYDMAREVAAFWTYYLKTATTTRPATARG